MLKIGNVLPEVAIGRGGKPPRVIIFAYAAAPDKGSEPGAGWGLIMSVSKWADCCVLTRPDHTASIRSWEGKERRLGLEFLEVSEPLGARLAKRHQVGRFLVYLWWLRSAFCVAKRMHSDRAFDIAYHATYSTYWLPSPVWRLGIPSVWGPVGGAVTTPIRLWPALGFRGMIAQIVEWACVHFSSFWPATRRTWRNVDSRIVQNDETLRRLPRALRERTNVLNHAIFSPVVEALPAQRLSHILWVAQMESRKGPRLAIYALAATPEHVRLVMVGDGPERRFVERLAAHLGVRDQVDFLGQVPRQRVFELLASSFALLNTGLREEGGVSFTEAMLLGTPVIALRYGGPETIARCSTSPERVVLVKPGGVLATARRLGKEMARLSQYPHPQRTPMLDSAAAAIALREIFSYACHRNPPFAKGGLR